MLETVMSFFPVGLSVPFRKKTIRPLRMPHPFRVKCVLRKKEMLNGLFEAGFEVQTASYYDSLSHRIFEFTNIQKAMQTKMMK